MPVYRQQFAPTIMLRPMLYCYRAENYIKLYICRREELHLPRDLVTQQIVIRIEILYPFTPCQLKQTIARSVAATVRTRFPAYTAIELTNNVEAVVRRPVINDNDLLVGPRLCERTFDRLGNPALGVVARDQNRDKWSHARSELRLVGLRAQ